MDSTILKAVFSDRKGNIIVDDRYFAAGRYFRYFKPLLIKETIPLPEDTIIFKIPDRDAVVFNKNLTPLILEDRIPVAAFIPPGYTQTLLASFISRYNKIILPLFSYTAIGYYNKRFYVSALLIDKDKRHKPSAYSDELIYERGEKLLNTFKNNRLIQHLVVKCAFEYRCPNARNLIMNKYEAPLPVSPRCNSRCYGCISFQKKGSKVPSPQQRLDFIPDEDEIFEVAEFHIKNTKNPIISFGQGCEGEPLMEAELIAKVIKRIKRKYRDVTININTNGSYTEKLKYLFSSGLDSARISLNSAQKELYTRYYKPVDYSFEDVLSSIELGRRLKKWISLNYFVFPGITDSESEFNSLCNIIERCRPSMIQLRNFNIDPDWYIDSIGLTAIDKTYGIRKILRLISKRYPYIRFGYFNPYLK